MFDINVRKENIIVFDKGQRKSYLRHERVKLNRLRISNIAHFRLSDLNQSSESMQQGSYNKF